MTSNADSNSLKEVSCPPEEAQGNEVAEPLSKRAQKKLKKRQMWLDTRQERRKKEKTKRKAKMEAKKRAKDFDVSYTQSRKRLKECKMADSQCKVSVVIDMSFGHLMHQRDLGKCCKQLMHCYSINRRLADPMQFHVTSMTGKSLEEMEKNQGFRNWDCNFSSEGYDQVFPKDQIVYLTSESENAIETLQPGKYYVIGGLVDHNNQKGLCHKLAQEKGISHGKLPLDQHVDIKTRKVLTIDHVFKILASVASEKKSWKDSFLEVLPQRKLVTERESQ